MHSRFVEVDGEKKTLEFGHEGVLYRQSFVMYDTLTDSKWNHSTGLAMAGKLAGTQLEIQPSWVVRWEKWKTMHPNTKVLARAGRGGFMGTYVADEQYSAFGLSVGQGPQAKLYPYDLLLKEEIVNDLVTPHAVVVVIDPAHKQAMAFSRTVGDKTLVFTPAKAKEAGKSLMRDEATGTLWDRFSGKAIEGPLKGNSILPLISVPWLQERWRQIYQEGIIYQGSPAAHRP